MKLATTAARAPVCVALIGLAISFAAIPAKSALHCGGAAANHRGAFGDSRQCLACHDGTLAPDRTPIAEVRYVLGRQGEHPVMISYEAAYRRKPQSLVRPAALDRRLQLIHGEIQCATCHVVMADGSIGLVIPGNGDKLCLSCHRK